MDWLHNTQRSIEAGAQRSAVVVCSYACSVSDLWRMCTDRTQLARWFADVQGDLAASATLTIDAGLPHTITSRVRACEQQRRLLITWSYDGDPLDPPDEVEVTFAATSPSSSSLTLRHSSRVLYPWASAVGAGWESWLWGLDHVLRGGADRRGAPDDVTAQIDSNWSPLPEPAATLTTSGTRRALRLERKLYAPRDVVWRALTTHFDRWYPGKLVGDVAAGADVSFSYPDGSALPGRFLDVTPPARLALREDQDDLVVELRDDGSGTLLVFTHTFDAPGAPVSCAVGWDGCLAALVALVDDKEPPPERAEERKQALRSAYAALLGV